MKRLQKQFLTALGLVAVGGGAGIYTLREKVKTPEVRFRELRESQRLFHFGRVDVKQAVLKSTSATVTFSATENGDDFRVTAPLDWPASRDAIHALLNHMASTILEPVLTEDATDEELERAGLQRPAITLAVDLKDDRQLTLHIGRKNKLLDRYPVTDSQKKKIGFIEPSGVWNYTRALDDYREKRIFAVPAKDVVQVDIEMPPGRRRLTLTRDDEGWMLDDPNAKTQRADERTVSLFLALVTKQLETDEFVSDGYDEAQGAVYGLAPPTLRLSVRTKGDTEGQAKGGTRSAAVGFVPGKGEASASTYIHIEGTRTLLRNTDPTLRDDLTKPATTFIDRTLSRFDPKQAHRFVLRTAGQPTVKAERHAKGWTIVEPETHEAKSWKLDAIVRLFSGMRAQSWHRESATEAQLTEWRLAPWHRRITVEAEDGRTLADVALGKPADDSHLFVKAWTSPRVGLLAQTTLRVLPDRWLELKQEE